MPLWLALAAGDAGSANSHLQDARDLYERAELLFEVPWSTSTGPARSRERALSDVALSDPASRGPGATRPVGSATSRSPTSSSC
jgi:hypothetical protein